jgi:hypothetical protein
MSQALSLTHQFGTFELPNYSRRWRAPVPREPAPITLISETLPEIEIISITRRSGYRLSAEEHDILFAALMDSVEIRATLQRE